MNLLNQTIELYRYLAPLSSDSYKYSHNPQYRKGASNIYSYGTSRGGEFDEIVWYGLQGLLKNYFTGIRITKDKVDRMEKIVNAHFGFPLFYREGWDLILERYAGKIPLKVYALPEGSVVSPRDPLFAVEVTDDDERLRWVTNFFETILSLVWATTTVASNSYRSRKKLKQSLLRTSDHEGDALNNILNFRLHDFGMRGVSSFETGAILGSAHLTSFLGTDTISALAFIQEFYADENYIAGFSIPASEHSTMTSWGPEGEEQAYDNMLETYKETMFACVVDSYNWEEAIKKYWGGSLRNKVLARKVPVVLRPDSGDPVVTTEKMVKLLYDKFGGKVNDAGFRVLHPNIRMIQGDGIDFQMLGDILDNFQKIGFSTENIAFGSGGGLLQKWNRDTLKFAIKCSSMEVDGEEIDVRKSPMEYNSEGEYVQSFKKSQAGRFDLPLIFDTGEMKRDQTFDEIRSKVMV